jgi:Arc/MetJ family transcription regulator
MSARKTSIEIDQSLYERARQALGTSTLKETVEVAFLHVLRERARREEVEALSSMSGMDLADEQVMTGAWRK